MRAKRAGHRNHKNLLSEGIEMRADEGKNHFRDGDVVAFSESLSQPCNDAALIFQGVCVANFNGELQDPNVEHGKLSPACALRG